MKTTRSPEELAELRPLWAESVSYKPLRDAATNLARLPNVLNRIGGWRDVEKAVSGVCAAVG